ncbi:DoxX family protein [Candidatus Woesearchaeota archaeon]|nr:DoxX family protein [Candidatus Woesearchaeota archaeon]
MGLYETVVKSYGAYAYTLARVLFGLLFFLHGVSKFSKGMPQGLMLVAGVIELLVGLGVFTGFFTRLAATGGAVMMVVAYFKVHAFTALSPLANGGELAVLFFLGFLLLAVHGNGWLSLEKALLKKEVF